MSFCALVLDQREGRTVVELKQLEFDDLPAGEVLVKVAASCLNYKDALAVTGRGKIIRHFPMSPGIDFAGAVVQSTDARYQVGDAVILTGWGVGERHSGGMAEYARVKADWLVPCPKSLSAEDAMTVGTAGLTAMLCVQALLAHGLQPAQGEVVVTGATGGVGSVAVSILAKMGFQVVAVSGKPVEQADYLRGLGATRVLDRAELAQVPRPLESEAFAGAVDVAGGAVLAGLLPRMRYQGAVAACGLAGGIDLHTTVMPFILRGVALLGVDSVMCPYDRRLAAWHAIAGLLDQAMLARVRRVIGLDEVEQACLQIMEGNAHGRVVLRLA